MFAAVASEQMDANSQRLIQVLPRAKHSRTDSVAFTPQPTDQSLAEDDRYMLTHLGRLIATQMHPHLHYAELFRSMDILRMRTGENSDTMDHKASADEVSNNNRCTRFRGLACRCAAN